jgi:POT family proton-dependent oligopeptide transporter
MLLIEGIRNGKVARDKVIAMLLIFFFNIMFWMFFEQAGSSFTFLADKIVDREMFNWTFPVAWFQTVNSLAIITCAPIIAFIWVAMRAPIHRSRANSAWACCSTAPHSAC